MPGITSMTIYVLPPRFFSLGRKSLVTTLPLESSMIWTVQHMIMFMHIFYIITWRYVSSILL
jgi:hypothetical protein